MVLMLAAPITAQSAENYPVDNAIVQLPPNIVMDLIAWLMAKTGWTTKELPSIRFVTPEQLQKIYHVGDEDLLNDFSLRALYSTKIHTVYLLESWNSNDLRDRATLLHELVHHLQSLNNIKATCLAEYEPQAFDLEFEWLREQGIQDPYKFLGIDEISILMISHCRDF